MFRKDYLQIEKSRYNKKREMYNPGRGLFWILRPERIDKVFEQPKAKEPVKMRF